MRRFLLTILCVLTLAGPVWATDYYIDATLGNNSNDGLSGTDEGGGVGPWQTFTNVNGGSFSGGDQILLKCGEEWEGLDLKPTSSGSDGNHIIIGSYGEGARPIINGQYDPTPLFINQCIKLNGVSYLTIQGLHIKNAKNLGFYIYGTYSNIIIDDCYVEDCGRTVAPSSGSLGTGIQFGGTASYVTVTDTTITTCSLYGIQCVANDNVTLTGNTVTDCYNNGIYVYGTITGGVYDHSTATISDNETYSNGDGIYVQKFKDVTISGNYSHDNDDENGSGEGYGIANESSENVTVTDNIVIDNRTDGLEHWSDASYHAEGGTISYNWFETNGLAGNNVYAIQITGDYVDGTSVHGNVIIGNKRGIGLHGSGNTSYCYNNTLYGNVSSGLDVDHGDDGWDIKNNILSENGTPQIRMLEAGADMDHTHSHNCVYNSGSSDEIEWGSNTYTIAQVASWEATAQNTDPLFIDAASGDFTLQAGSPCINAGLIGGTIANDDIRISGVDGAAFLDLTGNGPLTTFIGGRVTIIDSSSDELTGYIKAIGTGETYGSELFTDPSFDAVTKAAAKTVTGITKANPGVVTFDTGHGYVDGDIIYFSGLTEMTELNGEYWQLRSNAGDTFELATVYDTTSLDTSGYGAAETTGGACAQKVSFTNWTPAYATWVVGVDGAGALTNAAVNVGSGANQVIYEQVTAGADLLFRLTTICDALDAGTYGGYVAGNYLAFDAVSDVDTLYWYGTNKSANRNNGLCARASLAASFTDVSLKQVLTPSATGVTIVSVAGGSTYNWTSMDDNFNYNDAGDYTYKIYPESDYDGNPIVGELDIGALEYQGSTILLIYHRYQD